MKDNSARNDFLAGMRAGVPVAIAVLPFGLLFGALAIDNGFSTFQAVLMSAAVYAGASQMVGLDLFGQHIPAWLIVFSIFAVNFRHVLYSAAVGRRIRRWPAWRKALGFFFLVDPQFAEAERRAENGGAITFSWFMGMAFPVYSFWVGEAWLGGIFGRLVSDPQAAGLDFLLPIYFFGLVMGFRKRRLWLPVVATSAVASVVAYHAVGSPWHISIGALAGIAVAVVAKPASRAAEAAGA